MACDPICKATAMCVGAILIVICTVLNKTCWQIPFINISSQAFAAGLLIYIGYSLAKYSIKPFNYWQIALVSTQIRA